MKNRAGDVTSVIWLAAGFAFLYLPIVTLVVMSFNASPMVTSWGGWSLKWYSALAKDEEMISGFRLSLSIAALTACSSVLLGTGSLSAQTLAGGALILLASLLAVLPVKGLPEPAL